MRNQRPFILFGMGTSAMAMMLAMMLAPQETLRAALQGMSIWWEILFPSLFPFLVLAELLLGIGVVHGLGTLLDPLMKGVFRVSGKGGFVMCMGFASGYPVGARLAAQLWENRDIDVLEGERLAAFSSTSDPIFLIGAVCIGFFHMPELAPVLALSHYGGAIILGFLLSLGSRRSRRIPPAKLPEQAGRSGTIWLKAWRSMHEARRKNNKPAGILLEDAVQSSLRIVFVIGGLVVFFAVILQLMEVTHAHRLMHYVTNAFLNLLQLPAELAPAWINGVFEVTLGAKTAARSEDVPLMLQCALTAFILSWGGLSVHAQIMSIVQKTPFRYLPFMFARMAHGTFAFLLVIFLWRPLQPASGWISNNLPVFHFYPQTAPYAIWNGLARGLILSGVWLLSLLLIFLIIGSVVQIVRKN